MRTATDEQFAEADGYRSANLRDWHLTLSKALPTKLRFGFELQNPSQLLFVLRTLAELGKQYGAFNGALLWVTETEVGPPGPRSIALEGLECQRRAHGENRPVLVSPAHYFEANELELSLSMLTWLVLGDLHGYYYPSWEGPQYLLRVSGNSYIEFTCEEESFLSEVRQRVDSCALSYGIPVQ